jgi:hypothetical protein
VNGVVVGVELVGTASICSRVKFRDKGVACSPLLLTAMDGVLVLRVVMAMVPSGDGDYSFRLKKGIYRK